MANFENLNSEEFATIQPTASSNVNPLKQFGVSQKYLENFPENLESKSAMGDSIGASVFVTNF